MGSVEGPWPGESVQPVETVRPRDMESTVEEDPAERGWSEDRERLAEGMWPEMCPAWEAWSLCRAWPEEGEEIGKDWPLEA